MSVSLLKISGEQWDAQMDAILARHDREQDLRARPALELNPIRPARPLVPLGNTA